MLSRIFKYKSYIPKQWKQGYGFLKVVNAIGNEMREGREEQRFHLRVRLRLFILQENITHDRMCSDIIAFSVLILIAEDAVTCLN